MSDDSFKEFVLDQCQKTGQAGKEALNAFS
jgi:hypothetical protein